MNIESRVNFYYPEIDACGGCQYTEKQVTEIKRETYMRGAKEQRDEDARVVAIAAQVVYQLLSIKEITEEAFVNSLIKCINDDNS